MCCAQTEITLFICTHTIIGTIVRVFDMRSEVLRDVLLNHVVVHGSAALLVGRWHAEGAVHVFHQLGVEVFEHLDLLALHLLVVLVGLLCIVLLTVVLDEHRVDVADLHGVLDTWGIHELGSDLGHSRTIACIHGLSGITELHQVADLGVEDILLLLLVCRITLVELPLGLDHGFLRLLVRTELVYLYLGALVVEVGEALIGLGLAVELDDGLHDIRIVVPVLISQEVTGHDPDFRRTGCLSEAGDGAHIAGLEQALQTLDLLVGQGVDLRRELEVTLLLDELGDTEEDLSALAFLHRVVCGRWDQFLGPLLLQSDVVALSHVESVIKVAQADHDLDGLVILAVAGEEVHRLLEDFRVVAIADARRDIVNHVRQVVLHGEVHGAALIASLGVELHRLVNLTLLLEVLGALDLDGLGGL